jgi:hypothetical protein
VFRLYFFFQNGCSHCEEAEPALLKFIAAHPEGLVIRKNLRRSGKVAGFEPEATPAYLMFHGESAGDGTTHVGVLTVAELEKMLVKASRQNEDDIGDDEDDGSDDE